MAYGYGTKSYLNSTEHRESKKVRVPKSALERANHKIERALDTKAQHVTLTRAEWSELWMSDPANRQEFEGPLMCRCAQRSYPHEASIHRLVRYESRDRQGKPILKWPWTLRFLGEMDEPKKEKKP